MIKFYYKFRKPYFWPITPIFGTKTFFPKNSALTCTSQQFLPLGQNLEKNNDPVPRKCPDRWTDGRTEGQTDPFL